MRKYLVIIPAVIFFISGCSKVEITERNVPILNLETLTIDDRFDVILTQGSTEELKISGHPSLVKKVEVRQEGTEVHISSKSSSAWLRPGHNRVTLHITVKNLKRINVNETCLVSCSNELTGSEIGMVMTGKYAEADLKLNCGSFYFWNNFPCGGKVTLAGQTQQLKVWNYALMQIEASALTTNECLAENNSKGSIRSKVTQSLIYKIDGEGDIIIKGSPSTVQSLGDEGVGELIFE